MRFHIIVKDANLKDLLINVFLYQYIDAGYWSSKTVERVL